MAKIEMDISEYEAMKENKKLLESSIEKERELQQQIKKLADEKTKALEDAKMKVVKISRSEVREYLLRKKDDASAWRHLMHVLGLDSRILAKLPQYITTDHLSEMFFDKVTSTSYPVEETTTHGLDEIKSEIRKDLKEKMDSDIVEKIKNAEAALLNNEELLKENNSLAAHNMFLSASNKTLADRCEDLAQELAVVDQGNKSLDSVRKVLANGYGFWNKSVLLDKITSIISAAK